jgi:hypothetical protein
VSIRYFVLFKSPTIIIFFLTICLNDKDEHSLTALHYGEYFNYLILKLIILS